jgi:hypothetical protein
MKHCWFKSLQRHLNFGNLANHTANGASSSVDENRFALFGLAYSQESCPSCHSWHASRPKRIRFRQSCQVRARGDIGLAESGCASFAGLGVEDGVGSPSKITKIPTSKRILSIFALNNSEMKTKKSLLKIILYRRQCRKGMNMINRVYVMRTWLVAVQSSLMELSNCWNMVCEERDMLHKDIKTSGPLVYLL